MDKTTKLAVNATRLEQQSAAHHVGILCYPGAQLSAVDGLTDLFAVANRVVAERSDQGAMIRVARWSPADGLPSPQSPLKAMILPPSLVGAPHDVDGQIAAWLVGLHNEGTLLCSICAGAFLLAETGLLDNRAVSTHWALKDPFIERYPGLDLNTDRQLVDDGDIITASGLMAWIHLGLKLVERLLGPAIMLSAARLLLVDPGGKEERFYSVFAPKLAHGDAAIRKAQLWIQTTSDQRITLPMMAAKAGLGERTFLRRFFKATGFKPTQYLQYIRIGRAREMLESSGFSIEEVARNIGYEDAGAFREIFRKLMGVSPREYRRRVAATRSA